MVNKKYIIKSIEDAVIKCSKPHISSLPGDLRSNDVNKLEKRLSAVEKGMDKSAKKMVRSWKRITKMVDEWHNNLPNDDNAQLEWDTLFSSMAVDELSRPDYLLSSLEVSLGSTIFHKTTSDFTTGRTDALVNPEDFLWLPSELPKLCDYLVSWSNDKNTDWTYFNITDMKLFSKRVKSLKKEIQVFNDYKIERGRIDIKLLDSRIKGDKVNAKVSGGDEVYDLAKHTRGISEVHYENSAVDGSDGSNSEGLFSVVANSSADAHRLADKVGASEVHYEDGDESGSGVYTIIVPYK